jgi:hypothetical protein
MAGISSESAGILPAVGKAPMSDTALRGMVCEVVRAERASTLDLAFDAAARWFGMRPRRVRGWWHGEVADPRDSEARAIRVGYARWCEAETRTMEARLALLRARSAALRQEANTCGI